MDVDRQDLETVYAERADGTQDFEVRVRSYDQPEFFPELDPGMRPVRTQPGEGVVARTMTRWEDYNRPHDLPGFAPLIADLGIFDPETVQAGDVILPGVVTPYEAVRQSPQYVRAFDAQFEVPVNAQDEVAVDMSGGENQAEVRLDRPALAVEEDAATVSLTYRGEDRCRENRRNAEKVPAVLGTESQEGRILLGIEAELEPGPRRQAVERVQETLNPLEDGPYEVIRNTYTFDDGSRLEVTLLEIDQEAYQGMVEEYTAALDPVTVRTGRVGGPSTPMGQYVETVGKVTAAAWSTAAAMTGLNQFYSGE